LLARGTVPADGVEPVDGAAVLLRGGVVEKPPPGLEKLRLPLEKLVSGELKPLEPVEPVAGGLVENDREGAGVVVLGVVEKERDGDVVLGVVILGGEKDRLPELNDRMRLEKPLRAAIAEPSNMPRRKTTATTRARPRLTQVQRRMVPHPSG